MMSKASKEGLTRAELEAKIPGLLEDCANVRALIEDDYNECMKEIEQYGGPYGFPQFSESQSDRLADVLLQ
jgi:hypothetical protein